MGQRGIAPDVIGKTRTLGWMMAAVSVLALGGPGAPLAAQGIAGKKIPHLEVDQWVSLPKGVKKGPTLKELEGKVVYLYCFQSW